MMGLRRPVLINGMQAISGLVKLGYSHLLDLVQNDFETALSGEVPTGEANLFPFPYDWRRDVRAASRELKALVDRELPAWREHSGVSDAKVVILAHSMGAWLPVTTPSVGEGGDIARPSLR